MRKDRIEGDDRDVVDLADLHEALCVRTDFSHWRVRRVEAYGLERNVWVLVTGTLARGGVRHVTDVYGATTLAMVERTAVGRAVRDHYMRVEEELHSVAADAAARETVRLRAEVDELRAGTAGAGRADGGRDAWTPRPSVASVLPRLLDPPGVDVTLVTRVLDALGGDQAGEGGPEGVGTPPPEAARSASPVGRTTASATPEGANAAVEGRPPHMHRTSTGAVVDLRLRLNGAAGVDLASALAVAGCPPVVPGGS